MANDKVVVIGAGPAGIRAALALVSSGVRPTVIDEGFASGGQIYRRPPFGLDGTRSPQKLYGFESEKATRLHRNFDRLHDQLSYHPESTIWSVDQSRVSFVSAGKTTHVQWDKIILATGAMDRIIPLKGWTFPGAYSLGASQIALKAQAVGIGKRVVFFGTGPLLYVVAYQYAKAGIEVAAVLDTSRLPSPSTVFGLARGGATFAKGLYYLAWLQSHGIKVERGIRPLEIISDAEGAVGAIRYAKANGRESVIDTPAVAFGYGLKSETQIADLLGVDFEFDQLQRQWLPVQGINGRSSNPHVYLAGDGARIRGADVAELTGERAALTLLMDAGEAGLQQRIDMLSRRIRSFEPFRRALEKAFPFPDYLARDVGDDVMLCRCEGLTAGELRTTIADTGESEINRLKAFTRLGMGRCQGRVCMPAALEVAAAAGDVPIADAGRIRGQAPIKPVPLCAIAENAR